MSFNYAASKANLNPSQIQTVSSTNGVSDILSNGLSKPIKESLDVGHPLERIEKNRLMSDFQLNMNMLRNIQGIHAPLRISMEVKAFDNVGRLPFLPSSNLGKDVLLGRDDYIDFNDILNPPEFHEKMNRPYAVMDRNLTIL